MEAINNAASAAAKAVWGDNKTHHEPISGAGGDVSKGEPYDAGNLEPTQQARIEQSLTGQSFENTSISPPTYENVVSGHNHTDRSPGSPRMQSGLPDLKPDAHETPRKPRKPTEKPESLDSCPHENLGQNLKESVPERDNKEPTRIEGSRPEQLGSNLSANESENEKQKGTGQEYIRTTGFAADGGNFDATKPGAGREADRLMEEKDLHREEAGSHSEARGKPSLGDRIKAKLHKH